MLEIATERSFLLYYITLISDVNCKNLILNKMNPHRTSLSYTIIKKLAQGGCFGLDVYDRGIRLKQLREKQHLSQKEVADRLGLTRATISAYERNTKTPSVDILVRIALLYRSSADYILGLEDRANIFIDDLEKDEQDTIVKMVDILRAEFLRKH